MWKAELSLGSKKSPKRRSAWIPTSKESQSLNVIPDSGTSGFLASKKQQVRMCGRLQLISARLCYLNIRIVFVTLLTPCTGPMCRPHAPKQRQTESYYHPVHLPCDQRRPVESSEGIPIPEGEPWPEVCWRPLKRRPRTSEQTVTHHWKGSQRKQKGLLHLKRICWRGRSFPVIRMKKKNKWRLHCLLQLVVFDWLFTQKFYTFVFEKLTFIENRKKALYCLWYNGALLMFYKHFMYYTQAPEFYTNL